MRTCLEIRSAKFSGMENTDPVQILFSISLRELGGVPVVT